MKRGDVFRCNECGVVVEVLGGGSCDNIKCGDTALKAMAENTTDAAQEKHVPVIEKVDGGYKVSVGSVLHPMEEKHYIEWIELWHDNHVHRAYLKPGDSPVAVFKTDADKVFARESCNLHGVWKKE